MIKDLLSIGPNMQQSSGFSQRALLWAFTVVLALGVAGCSSETKERKTFINFLQTRIVDKPGLHVPRPTPEEEKSFGEYSKHFAVIRDFNASLDSKVSGPMRNVVDKGMPRSMADIMSRRADFAAARETSAVLRSALDGEVAKANAQRAALKQPDDLKVVYDKAYARTVTGPAALVKEVLPAIESTLSSAEKFAAFLEQHKGDITFRGTLMEVKDPALLEQANVLMKQMNEKSSEVVAAQRKLVAMVNG